MKEHPFDVEKWAEEEAAEAAYLATHGDHVPEENNPPDCGVCGGEFWDGGTSCACWVADNDCACPCQLCSNQGKHCMGGEFCKAARSDEPGCECNCIWCEQDNHCGSVSREPDTGARVGCLFTGEA
jgi:hypothetical protein